MKRFLMLLLPLYAAVYFPNIATAFDGDGDVVDYPSWDAGILPLHEFTGTYVRLLVPDYWIEGELAMTVEQRRILIDRADIVYQYYKELLHVEPAGDGLLTIAVVPVLDIGAAGGSIGNKGIEVLDTQEAPTALNNFKNEISNGLETNRSVVVHEMGHNFDVFDVEKDGEEYFYLWYSRDNTHDWWHAWTDFWDGYIPYYGRAGGIREPYPEPDVISDGEGHERWWREWTYLPYYEDATADWEECVRDELCLARGIKARDSWAGIMHRYAEFYSVEAISGAMAYLNAYIAADTSPSHPPDPEINEDLHIAMLADGANANLNCFVDEWRWYASDELRGDMADLYGEENEYCDDADSDSLSPLQGDCDDTSAAVRPGMPETLNNIDDDCNKLVDDILIEEPLGGDFPNLQALDLPQRIRGVIADAADEDAFTFDISRPRRLHVTMTSLDTFSGWFFLYDADDNRIDSHHVDAGETASKVYSLPETGQWKISVAFDSDSTVGSYELAADEMPWIPLDPWGRVNPPDKDGVDFRFSSSMLTLDEEIVNETPTQIRFWVTGIGIVAVVPYSDEASVFWTPPSYMEVGTYGVRAQLMTDTKPASDFTPVVWFDYSGPCVDDGPCDDGDACTIDECDLPTGLCSNTPLDCDDGNACTIDSCDAFAGECINDPLDCDDGNACTVDSCDPVAGDCVFTPDNDVYEAETMYHSVGNSYSQGWNIWSNGYISFNHTFIGGTQQMTVTAAGQNGNGWPTMIVTVGGTQVFTSTVSSGTWNDYTFLFAAPVGSREVRIYFTNDYYQPPLDRNLFIDKVTVFCGGVSGPSSLVATVQVHDDWGAGYCAHLDITNNGTLPTADWAVVIDSFDSNVNQYWNTPAISGTGIHTVKWIDNWNRVIGPGATYSQTGFCALRVPGTTTVPTVVSAFGVY